MGIFLAYWPTLRAFLWAKAGKELSAFWGLDAGARGVEPTEQMAPNTDIRGGGLLRGLRSRTGGVSSVVANEVGFPEPLSNTTQTT